MQAPPVINHDNAADTIGAMSEKTINKTPPAMFLVVNGPCGTNIQTPSHRNIAIVASPVSTAITIEVTLQHVIAIVVATC
jgi:hypothetical protein